ncbi:Excinuclease ABC subunit A [uncultured Flavonifractor sp.]|uniref:excinuclease ABC subunit UvrA n=1 Tax=Eubacteriales TaxID=186802 RepID=UPI0008231425|nr:excinuclease ABC subunit UvrA [Muriventricola aceti]MCU6704108.1 excinuclease ABC subunit UvrA [Muriventricola aceti]SCI17862.1 Excinuclease ABC subunit A [uncultured Flavonifractor sp.]SCJ68720.1 Excinuclease ABC subunit A [uncultured Flavonifractor sp.]
MHTHITVKGARVNNLKNIDVSIPRDKLVVLTGLSGSGKSSLAFDTIYAEGQRRYVESLSSYARMFLGQMEKPDVDYIDGLSPAISIDQKTTSKNPRSTVGTVTEIYDYLRLLWARVGTPHCPICGKEIRQQTIDQIIDQVLALPEATRIQVMAPVIRGKKGEHAKVFEDARKSGYVRCRADGITYDLSEEIKLEKNKKHDIEIVVDRLVIREDITRRLTDSVEIASNLAGGLVVINVVGEDRDILFSQNYACEDCGISIEELTPRMFSFNNPFGACPTCMGLGSQMKIDPDLIMPNKNLSIVEGGITASGWNNIKSDGISRMYFDALAKKYKFKLNTPIKDLPKEVLDVILYGTGGEKLTLHYDQPRGQGTLYQPFEGIVTNLERRYRETQSDGMKRELEECMSQCPCPTCQGRRLKKESLAVTVGGLDIDSYCHKSVSDALNFMERLELNPTQTMIAAQIVKEIKSRLGFLRSVGLQYLTLSREAGTLSGGESQRIRLATQIGSSLMGVLYILDEPSIGLHQRDNDKLLATLKELRDLGNTLLVVEHDEDTMREADYIIDVGPGAGVHGGQIVAAGTPEEVMNTPGSITGDYLSGRKKIPVPTQRRRGNGKYLKIFGARENNLRGVDVEFPLGTFTCVTGVSGSGKSSLVNEILFKKLGADLNRTKTRAGKHDRIEGEEFLDKVINIDQSPIGRTPRSNPATYTGLFNDIRDLFASTPDAKSRGYGPGRFSFNTRGGRCEACTGDGLIKIEMHFLPDIYVPCEVCKGRRYNRETLEVRYKGKNIYEVLEMTVDEALPFFENLPRIYNRLKTLEEVGLGYVKLGQPSTELSGGEAQRVKLATELSKRSTGKTIYILDEPTTGLHSADVHKLIEVLQRLVEGGNTVVVIEHNLDVIKTADHIIDLGPEGGDGGGTIVCTGTPEEVAACPASYTGQYLKKLLR